MAGISDEFRSTKTQNLIANDRNDEHKIRETQSNHSHREKSSDLTR